MSTTDPSVDEPVQPDEGQGGETTQGSAPWEAYLERFPEDVRDTAAETFREMDANVTKRFQEQSEFRKQWEPLADTGINQFPKEDVAWMVAMRQAVDDPQTMKQWIDGYAKEHNLTFGEAAAAVQEATGDTLDDFAYEDPSKQLEKLLEEKLSPLQSQVQEFTAWRDQQAQAAAEADALKYINSQVEGLESKHGAFDEQTKQLLNTLAGAYVESDPMNAITRAYDDLTRWRNDIETSTLQGKVDAPAPAEKGGIPDVSPEQHSRFDSPGVKDAAIEFLRNSNRA